MIFSSYVDLCDHDLEMAKHLAAHSLKMLEIFDACLVDAQNRIQQTLVTDDPDDKYTIKRNVHTRITEFVAERGFPSNSLQGTFIEVNKY